MITTSEASFTYCKDTNTLRVIGVEQFPNLYQWIIANGFVTMRNGVYVHCYDEGLHAKLEAIFKSGDINQATAIRKVFVHE